MEEKYEPNAKGRAAKGKIMTQEKYRGKKPGSLEIKISYSAGCLYVSLGQASLAGKPSQDPYALVYIHDPKTGLCKFQIGNNKTRTFDKNINPNFNTEFQFMFRSEFPPDPPSSERGDWWTVTLSHQDRDGHPAPAHPAQIFQPSTGAKARAPSAGYPSGTGASGGSPYPSGTGATGGSPYPSGPSGTPGTPYPGATGGSPYPSTAGTPGTPYPGPTGGSPYLSGPSGTPGTPYPGATGGSPYPSAAGTPGKPGSGYPGAK